PQKNIYTGAIYELTPQHLAELRRLDVTHPTHMTRYYLMVTTADEVLDYREAVQKYAGAKQLLVPGSDHGFSDFGEPLDSVRQFAGIACPQRTRAGRPAHFAITPRSLWLPADAASVAFPFHSLHRRRSSPIRWALALRMNIFYEEDGGFKIGAILADN